MTDLLSIPLKNSPEIDWVVPLKKLFKTANIDEDYFETNITELSKLRNLVANGKQLDKSQTGVEIISRYYDQILALESKLPVDCLKIMFCWEDAFDKGTLFGAKASTSLPFLIFERVCVLFNLGAFLSQLAAEHQLADSDEEMKSVAKWFQTSSGIFGHLSSSIGILSSEPLSVDLNPDTLSALSALMLAQAQEIFVTKAIKDKMKDSLVAKLCAQADDMYSDALLKLTKENVKFQWDRTWLSNVAGKQLAFSGLAQFFQGRACLATKRIGEEIARLNLCIETLTKAQNKIGNTSLFSFYVTEATRLAAEGKKDNDFIYHEQVPSTSNLSSIDKVPSARLAKPVNISQQAHLSTNFIDLFQNLPPISNDSNGSLCVTGPVKPKRSKTVDKNVNPVTATASASNIKVSAGQSQATTENASSTGEITPGHNQTPPENASEADINADGVTASPLRQALDASYYAVGYYVKQYLQGRKS